MNGKKARSIRKAVYHDRTFRARTYPAANGKIQPIGPVGNPKGRRVALSGGTLIADTSRRMYQYAKKMHKNGKLPQKTIKGADHAVSN